jgi:hypothetical protein
LFLVPIDTTLKAAHEKKEHHILESDYGCHEGSFDPSLGREAVGREMFKALVDLFQSDNMNKKMILRNKLISIQMSRSNNVTNYS